MFKKRDIFYMVLGALAVVVSNKTFGEEITEEWHPEEYCVEWKEHVAEDEYVMGLEAKVKDMYIFFVSEQKRQAEEAYLKTGIRYEW